MKQVVTSTPESEITLAADVRPNLFYGWQHGNNRGLIRSDQHLNVFKLDEECNWMVFCPSYFTVSNYWGSPYRGTLKSFIESLIKEGANVFEFNKLSELVAWCEEGK